MPQVRQLFKGYWIWSLETSVQLHALLFLSHVILGSLLIRLIGIKVFSCRKKSVHYTCP